MTASPPSGRERHGGLVLLMAVAFAIGILALVAGLLVAVSTRLDTGDRVPATLASVGTWAWVPLLVAALLLPLAAGLAWGRARPLLGVLTAVAVVGLVVQVVWLAPRFTPDEVGGSGPTVLTANLKYGAGDAGTVVRLVRERQVDLVALEEVTPASLARLRAAGLERLLPHAAGRPSEDADGTMVFSRYALTGATAVPVSLGGVSVSVAAPEPFRFLAVHVSDPLFHPGPWYADLGLLQRTVRASTGPVVVAGDFNTTLDHAPLRRVLERTGLRDGAEQAGSGLRPTWPSDRLVPILTIDHVLTGRGVAVAGTDRVRVPGSDHFGLLARLAA
ncbi:hypothetical protein GCM10011519_11950 [Marmoricola endophyticus]|uniref:Endonuclease/exonuclease/phosphatase domain-containing protein n=1 Tax=Marmoricola endophyticus TaxID=2040280 RepID=A0A917BE99_9ACTN|nr:endonuclease/exonuclease/phosphatase family protein [Marmoricola endophyticus]GGF39896.1 hypothetical protein GCM10011519_11950 [Marmoricola endophyticus]